jgi:hypothetical protein
LYYRQNQLNKDRVDQVTQYALILRDSAVVYKNKYGDAVTQVETARLDAHNMKGLKEQLEDITSRFNDINKRLANVEYASKATLSVVAKLEGVSSDTVVVVDSVEVPAFQFSAFDPYFKVEGVVIPSLKKVTVTPSFSAEVYAITYWKRKHKFLGIRFGKKQYKSEITSSNPYLKFSDYKVVTKKWD